MNLTSPSQVKAWCIAHDFHPNKTLGQNFLIDRNVLEAIVDAGLDGVPEGGRVLEIGPGLGVLTEEILRRGHAVLAIEKDPVLADELVPRMESLLGGAAGLVLAKGDALDVIAGADREPQAFAPMPEHMVSNLPYQAGTRILLELVQRRWMKTMTVLVQTEVAERLAAPEGGRNRSLAGVWTQLDYDVAVVRKVGASCFWPRPEIGSSVVRLVRHERNASMTEEERTAFRRLTKQAFAHRRKQLGTIFKREGWSACLDGQKQRRPEELSIDEWRALATSALAAC